MNTQTSMQPYVKKWYDFFAEGKIMGLLCSQCQGYEFPPVPVCSSCAGMDLDWVEMNGRAALQSFKTPLRPEPDFASSWPYSNGMVAFEEGPLYGGLVIGIGKDNFEEMYDRLPLPIEAEIQDRGDYHFLAFHLLD